MIDHHMPPIELVTKRNWTAPDLWDWEIFLTNRENTVTTTFEVTNCPTHEIAIWHTEQHILYNKPGWLISGSRRKQAASTDE